MDIRDEKSRIEYYFKSNLLDYLVKLRKLKYLKILKNIFLLT